ncbi:MAG: signal recognition particle receptor subunit alpha, partial [Clostridia bacterium]|nr:signal recognition particle receptor subunit alpha [Clostridia bacterium]
MGLFGNKDKVKDGLQKTRTGFWGNILNAFIGSQIDDDLYEELEEQLILADVGADVAVGLVDSL